MNKIIYAVFLLFLLLVFSSCANTSTEADTKNEFNQQPASVNVQGFISPGNQGALIVKPTDRLPHDPEFDGVYRVKGIFNGKNYYQHQNKNFFIFWDTGKDYGQTEDEGHTGGQNQWDLADRLGGEEIFYSVSENLLGEWSDEVEEDEQSDDYDGDRTGVLRKSSQDTFILESTGEIDVPHDPDLNGIYKKKGSFNGKDYYKHESKNYYIFWDTGKDYGQIESDQHTGGQNQWDLSDRLAGDEIIYSTSKELVGDWSSDVDESEDDEEVPSRTGVVKSGSNNSIVLQSSGEIDIAHDADLDGSYKRAGSFNGKSYYRHENGKYYIFWDTGRDYGATEDEQHTGGHHQWDLSDKLGGEEIIYSTTEELIGDWSAGIEEESEVEEYPSRTGVVNKGPKTSMFRITLSLEATGKIDIPHDPALDGIYEEAGTFNGKSYYKHQGKEYFIFWDTGKDYGETENERHTGGHQQWDLSDRLGGTEIIYSATENVLGDWSSDRVEDK